MNQPLAARPLREPHSSRLAPDHPARAAILAAHDAALAAGEAGYLDPETGLFVLTAAFLARRGRCCGRGCRHCPYVEDDDTADTADAERSTGSRRLDTADTAAGRNKRDESRRHG